MHKVFSSDYDFRIPDYQRPYAWGVEQADQLLSDLLEALERHGGEPYFLGSVVLVKSSSAPLADVIDGQQRLTTLTILLAVLRDLAPDQELRHELDVMVAEPGSRVRGLESRPRLRLRDRDAAFFAKYVQTAGALPALLELKPGALGTDSQRAVLANAKALHQRLSERTFLVLVSTSDLDSAHRIFSVMNARGLDLSPTDIFKSRIIGALSEEASDACATSWEDAEEALGRDGFLDLFLHIRIIFAIPEQVLSQYMPDRARTFVDDVVIPYADAYQQIRDQSYTSATGDEPADERVNGWFRRLAQLDNNDWRPPALWALRHHRHDPGELDRFFRALERLAASMLIRRVYTTPRVTRYADLLRELADGRGLDSPSFELTPVERAETLARLDGRLYQEQKIRKYVLLRLDEALSAGSGVSYHHPVITVEHVLPQKPSSGSRWAELFDDDARELWTHRLGNLVLLSRAKNSAAQNYDFADKKSRYFSTKNGISNFALTVQVLTCGDWTPEIVGQRHADLMRVLATEWQL
ncbi:DUF262 domain-containing protein [Streptacidiphilus jiangxiensis]|uniref:DUF262 domain-containing protein n=1 Tax=Streptacidiphilus jiangxiensis TaxID=235985 RepID=UPI001F1D9809|nr:DUF262 domain-containing protein [Streptacidiphilus jiangxiensis]